MKTGIWEGLGRGVTGVSENWGYLILGPGYYIRAPYFRNPRVGVPGSAPPGTVSGALLQALLAVL